MDGRSNIFLVESLELFDVSQEGTQVNPTTGEASQKVNDGVDKINFLLHCKEIRQWREVKQLQYVVILFQRALRHWRAQIPIL